MNSLDRKLATVFKAAIKSRKSDSKKLQEILRNVVNQDLAKTIERTLSEISRPATEQQKPETTEATELLRYLLDRGFKETSAVIFIAWLDLLNGLRLERVLPIAPTALCLDKWIKATKSSAQEVELYLLVQPNQTYTTVGADWLLGRPKPGAALPLFDFFLARQPRPEYLLPWNEALMVALKKDKRGDLLVSVLRQPWPNQDRIVSLIEIIRSNRALFKIIVDLLPIILVRKESDASIVKFVSLLFDTSIVTECSERKFVTTALARLGTGILLADRRTSNSDAVLTVISKTTRQLRNLTKGEAAQSDTWVLENLNSEEQPVGGTLCINLQGARYIALAFEKADQGFTAKDILAVTARYLGLIPIGKKGESVFYDPLQHEDVDGGLLPGASVIILESGWVFNGEAVMRAKIKKLQGENRV